MQAQKLRVVGSDSKSQGNGYQLNINSPSEAAAFGAGGMVAGYLAVKGLEYGGAATIAGARKVGRWFKKEWAEAGERVDAKRAAKAKAAKAAKAKAKSKKTKTKTKAKAKTNKRKAA